MSANKERSSAYWRATLRLLTAILIVWAVVSYGFGIIWKPALDSIKLGGYPLGFWIAHQGAIYLYVVLIFFYAWRMKKIDREHDVDED
ncbi:DUF4212 domain-containing protein [Caldimonas thermodepolymerans]|uniref:DUF4212 domain-containing protein n=1 Tax=Caldimonas thermodepolymerans TaxID=215580 RepID=A0A2S5T2L4_9BURK|nr:DUF4212 domain-containing protein [Caldimonas thermodepolymerans]PPE69107.1 DUF4212 domain-containing protein [Caldimonas thermodepolymerans]QPC32067.1 DUF4212 domain-containing protein [Caldimonas thermodepolymerans]RDH95920.1 putative solute:sodium symporter small subunit [Caldimonas thermodepolymerans]TCP08283.1 putative solute:sodium symporter small subunit [Caldimonas thermodepolymerans]UZG48604.1 DUF4212 domain-containing protein [Caldimonas thermodepolymerans]